MPAEVPVHHVALCYAGGQGAEAEREEAEAYFEGIEGVALCEHRRERGGDYHLSVEYECVVGEDEGGFFVYENAEDGERVGGPSGGLGGGGFAGFGGFGGLGGFGGGLRERVLCVLVASLDVAYEREADAFCGDGTVADDFSASFWEEDGEEDKEDGAEDGQEPEYGSPTQVLSKGATEKRAEGGSEEKAGQGVAHVSTSFGGGGNICGDCH